MEIETLLLQAQSQLGSLAANATRPEPERMDVTIAPADLVQAVTALDAGPWGYLSAITGLDHPAPAGTDPSQGSLEALYHFCAGGAVLTLRVSVPHAEPTLPSVCGVIPSATLYERELIEMFGLTVTGTPSTEHFILPEEWPAGIFPLRKDFKGYPEKE
jgi:Ni,Fe-hydrogenase III component G